MPKQEQSEQEQVRRQKLNAQRELGYPFPNDVSVDTKTAEFKPEIEAEVSKEEADRKRVSIAGRVMSMRKMGKAGFFNLQDESGTIQVYIKGQIVGEESFGAFKEVDIGDIVEVKGYGFKTKTEEPSVYAESFRPLVKCLHPLPEKWHGLSDVEVRYRRRYLDLIVNPEVRETFKNRSKIIQHIRNYFANRGYLEVETPVMSVVASGASARPFKTHHNALSVDLNMRIALELPLKKLVVGGFEKVFELSRVFRNEGISTEHNPEFTMIEFYEAYSTYEDLMDLTEDLFCELCEALHGGLKFSFKDNEIDFARPWARLSMREAVIKYLECSEEETADVDALHALAKAKGDDDLLEQSDYGKLLYELFDRHVESKLIQPVFITQHPTSISPLARPSEENPEFTDRFELMIAGMELANAFSELNDAIDQRGRFEQQKEQKAGGDDEAMELDEDFVTALEYGLPPTAGEGIGIDRLVMLLTNSASIRDVILFPTLRPQTSSEKSLEDRSLKDASETTTAA